MRPTIDFKECLKDSPKFRASLEDAEADIEILETRLEKLVKLCSQMTDTGKAFSQSSSAYIIGIRDLATYFHDDSLTSDDSKVAATLSRFAHNMAEMLKYFSTLMDQAQRSVCKNLSNFIKNDVRKVKETKKHFEKISDDLDNALIRNSQALRSKQQDCEEAANNLLAVKKCFHHTSLDYVFQINVLQSKKRFEVLGTMLSFVHAQSTFFHQGHDLFKDLEPYMKEVGAQVEELQSKAAVEMKEMEDRHHLVQQKQQVSPASQPGAEEEEKKRVEGYLFKRTSNAFKTWVRRWFSIQDKQLVYRKRSKDTQTVMEEDLRLCNVKPALDADRRFCFEIVSPTRSHILQADSDEECMIWINSLSESINNAYRETLNAQDSMESDSPPTDGQPTATVSKQPSKSRAQMRMEQLLSIPGNERCCDCGSAEPRWASINLGITLCIECSGIHRSFGVHLSKVRSITLDTWDPELIKVMAELGNDVVNRIYEARVDESVAVRATPECSRTIREAWIRAKYVKKAFVVNLPGAREDEGSKIRSWSVKKKLRRSPGRKLSADNSRDGSPAPSDSEDVTSGLMEAVLSVSSNSKLQEAQASTSSTDVIVFGRDSQTIAEMNKMRDFDLESSGEESGEGAEDERSTTSWEDVSRLDPNLLLCKAAEARNLPVMLEALAHGADPNWPNPEECNKTPIMKALETGSLAACEFLLLNNAKLDRRDDNGRTPLHHATILGHTGLVCQFLKRGADQTAQDNEGNNPLSIAIETANADIVTLLRLSKLNDEMKEADGGFAPGDETFTDVFRDFSNMASNNPEKLKRK